MMKLLCGCVVTILKRDPDKTKLDCGGRSQSRVSIVTIVAPRSLYSLVSIFFCLDKMSFGCRFLTVTHILSTLNYNSASTNITGQFRTQIEFISTGQYRTKAKSLKGARG